jgi:D-alanyl-D-alanine carboxypeptidase-like protein
MPPTAATKKLAASFMQKVPLKDVLPINKNMSSAKEHTMISIMGSPKIPLTTKCQNARASDIVKALTVTERITDVFRLTGIKPALDSARAILAKVFEENPDLEKVLSTEGMLCTRYRKPTSGKKSTAISNHSWGTAIDFKIVGFPAPGNTGQTIPKFIAILLPHFNKAGWFSGIAFHDTMHFEVSEETIRKWSNEEKFKLT